MTRPRSKLTSQGQISVPAEVRRKLGIGPGAVLEWDDDDGLIIVRRAGQYSSADIHRAIFGQAPAPAVRVADMDEGVRRLIRTRHARR
jgi:antitoxin PrlF